MYWSMLLGVGALSTLFVNHARAEEAEGMEAQKDAPWYVKRYDTDGDGQLSDAERDAAKAAWKAKQHERDLKRFDKDGDGQLSAEEQAEATSAHEARKQRMLEKFDKDNDGKLSES